MRCATSSDDEPEGVVHFVEAEAEDPGHPHRPRARLHAGERIQRAVRREQRDPVADVHAELLREILAEHDAVVIVLVPRLQVRPASPPRSTSRFRDGRLELGIDAFEADERIGATRRRHRAADERRRRADNVRNLAQRLDFGAIVLYARGLEHERVRGRAENAIAQLALQAGHHRHRENEREHADRHAERGDERNDRDERLAPAAEQIAQSDLKLEWHVYFGRMCGNRMTSRIDLLSVSSITRRSMPTPSPAVGGSPYSSART